MEETGKLGAGAAIGAYAALLAGMLLIGAPAQQQGIVAGLWITEALAIALPAVFVLTAAGVKFAPWLGLRAITAKQALVAVAVAAPDQPIVSFFPWAGDRLLSRAVVAGFGANPRLAPGLFAPHRGPGAGT